MAGMGPPPKPAGQRRRTNATVPMVQLPAEGRKGSAPAWPLARDANEHEQVLWDELWALPQAVAWERFNYGREVAQYVVWKIMAEAGSLDASKESRQISDRLGLTPLAMLRLRWEVVADEVADQRKSRPASSRRLKAVDAVARAV